EGHEGEHQRRERIEAERGVHEPLGRLPGDLADRLVDPERHPPVERHDVGRSLGQAREPDVEDRAEGEEAGEGDRAGPDDRVEELGLRVRLLVGVRVGMPVVLLRLGGRLVAVRILVEGERFPLRPVLEQVHEPVDEEARQREERDQPDEVFHPCIVCASSTFRVLRWRKSEIVSASPMAASPAAIVMTKTEKTWPVSDDRRLENATRFRLTAFNISSTDIRTVRKLRRTRTPKNPIEKSRNETIKK